MTNLTSAAITTGPQVRGQLSTAPPAALLLPPSHKELLEEEDVYQNPADDGDEDPVFGVPGDANFFKRPDALARLPSIIVPVDGTHSLLVLR